MHSIITAGRSCVFFALEELTNFAANYCSNSPVSHSLLTARAIYFFFFNSIRSSASWFPISYLIWSRVSAIYSIWVIFCIISPFILEIICSTYLICSSDLAFWIYYYFSLISISYLSIFWWTLSRLDSISFNLRSLEAKFF